MKDDKVNKLKDKIKELENCIFYIDMVDRWTGKEQELYNKYNKELKTLKDLLIEELTKTINKD